MSELYQKIELAIASYLKQYVAGDPTLPESYWPLSLKNTGGQYRIFTGESDMLKDGQAILCIAEDANEEAPQFTGNQMVPCMIWLRTPVKVLTASEVTDLQKKAIQNHAASAGILSDALNQNPFLLASYINASGADFTIMGGLLNLQPHREEPPNFFASGWSFRVYAMNKTAP